MTRREFHAHKKGTLAPGEYESSAVNREFKAAIEQALLEGKPVLLEALEDFVYHPSVRALIPEEMFRKLGLSI